MLVRLSGQEFEQTPGDGDGQGSLESCSPWGRKELDMTEQLTLSLSLFTTSEITDHSSVQFTHSVVSDSL